MSRLNKAAFFCVAQDNILCYNQYSTTPASYSTEISGCTFLNNTTSQLYNGLYASNSTNILFRNNNFTSSVDLQQSLSGSTPFREAV